MIKNFIKKNFFTNKISEFLLINLSKLLPVFKKSFADNRHYKKNTYRLVKRDGIFFELDISDYREYVVYFNLDFDSSKPILEYLPHKNGTIVDIGANIGQTALWIAQHLNHKKNNIIAFEPIPTTFKKLKKNIALNKFNNILVKNIALGNENKDLVMAMENQFNSGGFSAYNPNIHNSNSTVIVKQIKLDDYNFGEKENITFIKIDVEGFEYKTILGAEKIIKKHKPILYVELSSGNLENQNTKATELIQLIRSFGYNYIVNASTLNPVEKENLTNCHIDILCKIN